VFKEFFDIELVVVVIDTDVTPALLPAVFVASLPATLFMPEKSLLAEGNMM
jgi:hypothetical protein